MARTKKPVPNEAPTALYQNRGGYMIDPPVECEGRVRANDGAVWVSINSCMKCIGCERWLEYEKLGHMARFKDAETRGVFIDWKWFNN